MHVFVLVLLKTRRASRFYVVFLFPGKKPINPMMSIVGRPELLACLFNALGGYTTGYLRSLAGSCLRK